MELPLSDVGVYFSVGFKLRVRFKVVTSHPSSAQQSSHWGGGCIWAQSLQTNHKTHLISRNGCLLPPAIYLPLPLALEARFLGRPRVTQGQLGSYSAGDWKEDPVPCVKGQGWPGGLKPCL